MFKRILDIKNLAKSCFILGPRQTGKTTLVDETLKDIPHLKIDLLHTVPPYVLSSRKRITKHPKIYIFDCGVINAFTHRLSVGLIHGSQLYEKLFEHFIVLELFRLIQYYHREIKISFLRYHSGLEIDIILEEGDSLIALEIKSNSTPHSSEVKNLINFGKEFPKAKLYLVCTTPRPYEIDHVQILPWKDLFTQLRFPPKAA